MQRWIVPAGLAAGSLALWWWSSYKKMAKNLPEYGSASTYEYFSTFFSGDDQKIMDYLLRLGRTHGPIYRER
jgi:hypothetical protein